MCDNYLCIPVNWLSVDKKFAVKARLSGILLVVVGLLKKYQDDQEKLVTMLKLLQAFASSSKEAFGEVVFASNVWATFFRCECRISRKTWLPQSFSQTPH